MLKSPFLDKTIFGTRFSKVRPERRGAWLELTKAPGGHDQHYIATGSGIGRGKILRESILLISLNTADFTWNCTFYDVISAALERFEFCSSTLMHSSSPDKHICGWVDPQRSWFIRNAFPQFRLKMTKIANFARAVARPTKVDSEISTDFWKAQTMLFLKRRNENFRTCFL